MLVDQPGGSPGLGSLPGGSDEFVAFPALFYDVAARITVIDLSRLQHPGEEFQTNKPEENTGARFLEVFAKGADFAIKAVRRMRGTPLDDPFNWWALPLPRKMVMRSWFGSVPDRLGAIYRAPAWLAPPERLALYAIVYGVRPRRALEIGTFFGGSAMIIVAALDDIGAGSLECVDPTPRVSARRLRRIQHRATIHPVRSPEGIAPLAPTPDDRFDFVLIDGDHSYQSTVNDFEAVREVLADDAVVLCHDAHYYEVADAVGAMLKRYPEQLIDCGLVSTLEARDDPVGTDDSKPLVSGGLRMLRWTRPDAKPNDEPSLAPEGL